MEITRGDYKKFKFKRTNKNGEVITELPDKMYLTIKDSEYTKKALIQKTLENGIAYDTETNYYYVEILPEDTDNLNYGSYKYDIEVVKDNKPKTIKIDTFRVTKEITFAENEV